MYQDNKQIPRGDWLFFFLQIEDNLNISSVNNRAFCDLSSKHYIKMKTSSNQRERNADVIGLSKSWYSNIG